MLSSEWTAHTVNPALLFEKHVTLLAKWMKTKIHAQLKSIQCIIYGITNSDSLGKDI